MNKSTGVSLLFFFIFLMGIVGIVVSVNQTLNKRAVTELHSTRPDNSATQQSTLIKG